MLFCSTNEELQATLQELEDLREQLTECTLEVQQLQEEKQVQWRYKIITETSLSISQSVFVLRYWIYLTSD